MGLLLVLILAPVLDMFFFFGWDFHWLGFLVEIFALVGIFIEKNKRKLKIPTKVEKSQPKKKKFLVGIFGLNGCHTSTNRPYFYNRPQYLTVVDP